MTLLKSLYMLSKWDLVCGGRRWGRAGGERGAVRWGRGPSEGPAHGGRGMTVGNQ